ncbi:MAG: Fic family protein [Polyangiaceae bacterium]
MKDSLIDWLSIRGQLQGISMSPIEPIWSQSDGHLRFLEQRFRGRDPTRFERMSQALALARSHALARQALGFDRLASWQNIVLGRERSPFRVTPAFAKQGRERYGVEVLTESNFESCLRDADAGEVPVCLRAARAYLDVLFFHPFDDGNARAASLTLDFILAREGILLDQVAPLFVVTRRADDAAGAVACVRLVELLVLATATRHGTQSRARSELRQ